MGTPEHQPSTAQRSATAIAWSPDESTIALGFADGLVTIHTVDDATGGPASELGRFDFLEARETIPLGAFPDEGLEDERAEGLREDPASGEHLGAVETLLAQFGAARFDPLRQAVWVTMKYGRLKRVGLGDEANSGVLVHRDAEGVRDFAALTRRLGSHVLSVSPRGRFLGFGHPNDFRLAPTG